MILHGEAPFLECSSKGDRRFSAFSAMLDGRSIEDRYQAAKIFEGGITGLTWRQAKGRQAVNQAACAVYYSQALGLLYCAKSPSARGVACRLRSIRYFRSAGSLLSGNRALAH